MLSNNQTTPTSRTGSGVAHPSWREIVRHRLTFGGWNLPRLFETVTDLPSGAQTLRRRRYGVIEIREGRLQRILLRPFPKLVSLYEVKAALLLHGRRPSRDRCLLYYNAPRQCPDYLTLRYLLADRGASVKTLHTALATLDEIARLRRAHAIVCDAANPRLSQRLMERYGWVRHCEHLRGRHYIKRFGRAA